NTANGDLASAGNGGGIYALKQVVATGSNITANSASADANNGGGLWVSGSVTLNNSHADGNTAGFSGGGIYSPRGNARLTHPAASNNAAGAAAGSAPYGGGITAYNGQVTLAGSTVSHNRLTTDTFDAQGGGVWASGNILLNNSHTDFNTVYGSGGGVFSDVGT